MGGQHQGSIAGRGTPIELGTFAEQRQGCLFFPASIARSRGMDPCWSANWASAPLPGRARTAAPLPRSAACHSAVRPRSSTALRGAAPPASKSARASAQKGRSQHQHRQPALHRAGDPRTLANQGVGHVHLAGANGLAQRRFPSGTTAADGGLRPSKSATLSVWPFPATITTSSMSVPLPQRTGP